MIMKASNLEVLKQLTERDRLRLYFEERCFRANFMVKRGFRWTGSEWLYEKTGTRYDELGFDVNGYDAESFDVNGINRYTGVMDGVRKQASDEKRAAWFFKGNVV